MSVKAFKKSTALIHASSIKSGVFVKLLNILISNAQQNLSSNNTILSFMNHEDEKTLEKFKNGLKQKICEFSSNYLNQNEFLSTLENGEKLTIYFSSFFVIKMSEIAKELWDVDRETNRTYIKEQLLAIKRQELNFNVFNIDGSCQFDVRSSILTDLVFNENYVIYRFHDIIEPMVLEPKLYGKVSLRDQKRLSDRASILIHEHCLEFLGRKRTSSGVTEDIDIKTFSILLGASKSWVYYHVKTRFLLPAIDDINKNTNLNISLIERKMGSRIKKICFQVQRKEKVQEDQLSENNSISPLLQSILREAVEQGVQENSLRKQIKNKEITPEQLKEGLKIMRQYESRGKSIKNKTAFLRRATQDNWMSFEEPEEVNKDKLETELIMQIHSLNENETEKVARLHLLTHIGTDVYKAWFLNVRMRWEEEGSVFSVISPSRFMKDWIETHYGQKLRDVLYKSDLKIDYPNLRFEVEDTVFS